MVPAGRFIAMLAGVALVCLGLGLGAQSQREQYKGVDSDDNSVNLSGDPIAITGLFVAAGCLTLVLVLARPLPPPALPRPMLRRGPPPRGLYDLLVSPLLAVRRRLRHTGALLSWKLRPSLVAAIGASLAILVGTYIALHMTQLAWPRVVGLQFENGQNAPYDISIGLLASNSRGIIPAVQGPLIAITAGAFLTCAWGLSHLWRTSRPDAPRPSSMLSRHLAASFLAAPFLVIAGWGAVAALVRLPSEPASTPFLLVLPLVAIGMFGLLGSSAVKAWQLARASRHPTRLPVAVDAWHALGRIEAAVAVALLVLFIGAGLLPRVQVDGLLEDGAPFRVGTVNVFLQLQLLLAIPLVPLAVVRRRVLRALARPPVTEPPARPRMLWIIPAAFASTFVLAAVGTWPTMVEAAVDLPERALWAWVYAALPLVVAAFLAGEAMATAAALAIASYAMWSIGNTVYAHYTPSTVGVPEFDTPPGHLGLFRFIAAALAAWALARLARRAGEAIRPAAAVPLAIGFGIALTAVAFVELPLIAGPDPTTPGAIVVGSAVAASDESVRVFFHLVAAASLTGGTLALARLLRPEWFATAKPPPRATTVLGRRAAETVR